MVNSYFYPAGNNSFENSISLVKNYCNSTFNSPLGFLGEERTHLYKVTSLLNGKKASHSSFFENECSFIGNGSHSISILIFTTINEVTLECELERLTKNHKKLERLKFEPEFYDLEEIQQINHSKPNSTMETDANDLYEKEVFIRESGWLKRLLIKDIEWIKVEGVYTHVYSNSQLHTLRCTSKDIFSKLPKSLFFQVHKSYFVNIFKIDALKRYSLKIGNDVLPIGKTFYNKLLDKLPHLGG